MKDGGPNGPSRTNCITPLSRARTSLVYASHLAAARSSQLEVRFMELSILIRNHRQKGKNIIINAFPHTSSNRIPTSIKIHDLVKSLLTYGLCFFRDRSMETRRTHPILH